MTKVFSERARAEFQMGVASHLEHLASVNRRITEAKKVIGDSIELIAATKNAIEFLKQLDNPARTREPEQPQSVEPGELLEKVSFAMTFSTSGRRVRRNGELLPDIAAERLVVALKQVGYAIMKLPSR